MTQLALYDDAGRIELPEALYDLYSCPEEELSSSVEMISGRYVYEIRGMVWKPSISFDYLSPELWKRLDALFKKKQAFRAQFMPDNVSDGTLLTSTFICESITRPKYAFSDDGVPYWHGLSFTLREAEPHD